MPTQQILANDTPQVLASGPAAVTLQGFDTKVRYWVRDTDTGEPTTLPLIAGIGNPEQINVADGHHLWIQVPEAGIVIYDSGPLSSGDPAPDPDPDPQPAAGFSDDFDTDTSADYTVSAGTILVNTGESRLEFTAADASWNYVSSPEITLESGQTYTVAVDYENTEGTASLDVCLGSGSSDPAFRSIAEAPTADRAGARQRKTVTFTGVSGTDNPVLYVTVRWRGGGTGLVAHVHSINVTQE